MLFTPVTRLDYSSVIRAEIATLFACFTRRGQSFRTEQVLTSMCHCPREGFTVSVMSWVLLFIDTEEKSEAPMSFFILKCQNIT